MRSSLRAKFTPLKKIHVIWPGSWDGHIITNESLYTAGESNLKFCWQKTIESWLEGKGPSQIGKELDAGTENEVEFEIRQLNGNKSCGHDEIPPKLY